MATPIPAPTGPPGHSPSQSVGGLTPGRVAVATASPDDDEFDGDEFDPEDRLAGLTGPTNMSQHSLRASTTLNSPEQKLPSQAGTPARTPTHPPNHSNAHARIHANTGR